MNATKNDKEKWNKQSESAPLGICQTNPLMIYEFV